MPRLPRFSRASVLFISWFSVLACCESRFSSVFFLSMGLSSSQAGIVLAVRPFVALGATPLWSALADKSGKRDRLMLVCGSCAFATFMLYSVAHFEFLPQPWVFSYILCVRIINSIFSSPVYTMIAASCLDVRALILPCFILRPTSFAVQTHCSPFPRHLIDETLEKIGFGVLFLGAAFMSLPVSLLTRQAVLFRYYRFPFAFVAFVGFLAACRFAHQPKALDASQNGASVSLEVVSGHESDTDALVAKSGSDSQIDDTSEQKQLQQQHQRRSVFQILRLASGTVFGSVSSVVFFLNLFFINIGTNVVEGLVFMFFKNDLGASSTVLGWSVVVTVLFEIPLMYWAPQLLKRFETGTLIVVAELSYSIRTLVYTLVGTNTWLLLLVEPLHGVTYALLATSTTEHVASVVSPGLQTSAQSLPGVISGIASIVGNAGGGWIMQTYGSNVLYRTTSAMVLCSTVLFLCFSSYHNSKRAQKTNEKSTSS